MKTTKFFIGLLTLIIAIFSGCDNKTDNPTTFLPDPNPTYRENAKLKKVVAYTSKESPRPLNTVEEYEYDAFGRLNKVTGPVDYNQYEYNNLGQLVKITNHHANINAANGFINLVNYIYTYSSEAQKEKVSKENGSGNLIEYTLYFYEADKLMKTERYDADNMLVELIEFTYNDDDQLIKETTYAADQQPHVITNHIYVNGVNIRSDVFRAITMEPIREINRTFDINNNLIMLESNEKNLWSALQSFVFRYEYYEN